MGVEGVFRCMSACSSSTPGFLRRGRVGVFDPLRATACGGRASMMAAEYASIITCKAMILLQYLQANASYPTSSPT